MSIAFSTPCRIEILVIGILLAGSGIASATEPIVDFPGATPGRIPVFIAGKQVALYEYNGNKIPRPFLSNVRALNGVQVTRNHPPVADQDLADHPEYHPGIWMSFGDLSGADYWRNQATVRTELLCTPKGGEKEGSFAVRNHYLDPHDLQKELAVELCQIRFLLVESGYIILWDSTFSSDQDMWFGDQEEMGIAFRTATALRADPSTDKGLVSGTGHILDATKRKGSQEIWGTTAPWCDYSGQVDGEPVGIAFLCHPENFRPSWFHARDYGLLAANPFGRAAFGKGEPSKVVVAAGETLRLRYGILIHNGAGDNGADVARACKRYVSHAGD
ncbi:DUF6807 family protein [Aeoliella sp. SH292]|uniref:DUF6807 family protein n=1 Tax=Aeoliella sp. SH292 TaxID=3454464 RepID=UPI003F9C7839